jgi:glycerate kinase
MTAVIEIAGAAGLTLIPENQRNPMDTTTFGVGEVIYEAMQKGCRRFIIGLGGSGTNDGGAGMLQALGMSMVDQQGNEIPYGARGLSMLEKMATQHLLPQLSDCSFLIACDVENPLCGKNGCSRIFAPQKGASEEEIVKMDLWLSRYAAMIKTKFPGADACAKGAGAAGGLGFAFQACLKGKMVSGAELLMRETGLLEKIGQADLVLTGEGCLDGQTAMGKAPVRLASEAKKYQKPVIAFAGKLGEGAGKCMEHGITSYHCITPEGMSPAAGMKKETALKNMEEAVYRVIASMQKEREG